MHYFPNFIFGLALYIFQAVPLPIIRCSTTVHSALVHVIQVFEDNLSSRVGMELSSTPTLLEGRMTCTNAECTVVELLMMGRGTARNM